MASTRKNKSLYIDLEAVASMSLAKEGILSPCDGLMCKDEANEVDNTGLYKGKSFPFSFILAPSGKRNAEVLASLSHGETIDLVCAHKKVGELTVDEVYSIDPLKRVQNIYGTTDMSNLGVASTYARLGKHAVCGKYEIEFDDVKKAVEKIQRAKQLTGAKHTTALVMAARPLNRAHERLIRLVLEKTELVVIFLLRPYSTDEVPYPLRHEALEYLIQNYLPQDRVVVVPFENTYLFAGTKELILDAIAIQNFGCDRLVVAANHAGLNMFYEHDEIKSIFDSIVGVDIEIEISNYFVYCNICKTLVTKKTCPHGKHHHIEYNSDSILELLKAGLLPPAILMRREISALYLSCFFPNRFKNLGKLYNDLITNAGLIEEHTERDFYIELLGLYQTTSLT